MPSILFLIMSIFTTSVELSDPQPPKKTKDNNRSFALWMLISKLFNTLANLFTYSVYVLPKYWPRDGKEEGDIASLGRIYRNLTLAFMLLFASVVR